MKRVILILTITTSLIKAQQANTLIIGDTRDINHLPDNYHNEVKAEFKTRNVVGVPGDGYFSGMLTIAPWLDQSGGKVHQLNFNDGGIFYRNGLQSAQWGSWNKLLMEDVIGNVGIGTSSPSDKLEVVGNVILSAPNNGQIDKKWILHTRHDQKYFYIAPRREDGTDWDWPRQFLFSRNGDIAISGKLEAREVKVTQSPTADFVFSDNYILPRLEDIEKHIKEKKHLPEIASAKEMEQEGVNIGEFQIKLLQKIEELTLYTIEQNKQLKKQSEENNRQSKKIKQLVQENQQIKFLLERVEILEKNK